MSRLHGPLITNASDWLSDRNWYGHGQQLADPRAHQRAKAEAQRLNLRMKRHLEDGEPANDRVVVWALARPAYREFQGDLQQEPAPSIARLYPSGFVAEKVVPRLRHADLQVTSVGHTSLSFETTVGRLRSLFGARLEVATQPVFYGADRVVHWPYLRFASPARLPRQLDEVLQEIGLPCPPTFARATPPGVGYTHLALPKELAECVQAFSGVYRGEGVKVALIDTGVFLDHEYFRTEASQISVTLAGDAMFARLDEWGHGTALTAAVSAVAPDAELTMVKLPMEAQDIALRWHTTDALRHVLQHNKPDIVICAWGLSENHPDLPKDLGPEMKAASIADNVVFVCAAGNCRDHLHPANLNEVIAVGGAYRDSGQIVASNFTSSFTSQVTQKSCPDLAGPSGDAPLGICVMAPTGRVSFFDVLQYHEGQKYPHGDETLPGDGWCGIGGSSIAAAVVGGVAALVRSASPALSAAEVKEILLTTAERVTKGINADGDRPPKATGAGFVNAKDAVEEALRRRPKFDFHIDPEKPFGLPVRK